jgi:hypothetical protein
MLASDPASMVNQKQPDLGIPNRFNLNSLRFSCVLKRELRVAEGRLAPLKRALHSKRVNVKVLAVL